MEGKREDKTVKCIMVGDVGCGKSYATSFYSTGIAPTSYDPTLVDRMISPDYVIGEEEIDLEVWDTGGQDDCYLDRKTWMCKNYDANVAIIAFALNNVGSLIHAQNDWLQEIIQNYRIREIPILLVGMKKDLVNEITDTKRIGDENDRNKICTKEQINTAKRIIKPVAYHTCSTFHGNGIEEQSEYTNH